MEIINPRISTEEREALEEICNRTGWKVSEVARTLIEIGIGIEMEEGLIIEGFLFTRPFAEMDFRKTEERIGLQISGEIKGMAIDLFNDTPPVAIRKAMLNGLAILNPIGRKTYTIKGPFRGSRPFIRVEFPYPKLKWKPAKKAWKRLTTALKEE